MNSTNINIGSSVKVSAGRNAGMFGTVTNKDSMGTYCVDFNRDILVDGDTYRDFYWVWADQITEVK